MTVRRYVLLSLGVVLIMPMQTVAEGSDLPSDDFLEYLATLVDQDGEWIDPLELEELPDELDLDVNLKLLETDAQYAEETP